MCTHRERQRVRARVVATNYPFVKLMEIAESVPTGTRAANACERCFQVTKILNFYNFMREL